ncbi:MAG: HAMP domain-containing histidine kinase [Clostridia bacterium]|nr:HAMP domain-containing histidine kinase [Clostridia bacterium]
MSTAFEHTAAALLALRRAGNDGALREMIGEILLPCSEAAGAFAAVPPTVRTAERLCLQLLRESDNRRNAMQQRSDYYGCDVCALLEHASLAADVLLTDARRSLCFTGESLLCGADPTLLLGGYLNLVANAVQYGTDDVFVDLQCHGDAALLSVETNAGAPLPTAFHDGLRCAANAARLHGGRLLLASSQSRFCAVMRFQTTLPWERLFTPPRFSQYLETRVSPLRIALCEVLE